LNGSSGGFGGTMVRASRFPELLVLGKSAWRQSSTAKISECKEERVEIFWRSEPEGQKILPEPCMEKSPYIESESKLTSRLLKNVIISRVYNSFRSYQI
jgi:hypothetical protein